jgi:hypothetical protein
MKRLDTRILVGAALILAGSLILLDQTGILKGAAALVWVGILTIGAAICLFWFFSDRSKWWAAIPGFSLAGLAASALLPNRTGWGGLAFLVGIGLGFWAVYFSGRTRWWAILPGGVLVTLGVTAVMSEPYGAVNSGGVFLAGLGLTFGLVALLAKMKWAFIPAAVLLLLGILIGMPFAGVMEYLWIGVLLAAGMILVVSALRK